MKTIEERIEERIKEISIEVGNNCADFYSRDIDFNVIAEGLRQIATEQKRRTLDKVYRIITDELGRACGTALIKVIQNAFGEYR